VDDAARQFIESFQNVRLSDLIAGIEGTIPLCDTEMARKPSPSRATRASAQRRPAQRIVLTLRNPWHASTAVGACSAPRVARFPTIAA
jgi:hypothetical protein